MSLGAAVSANHSKMEGSFNATTLQETKKVESLSEEDKEVVVEVAGDGKSKSLSETQEADGAIKDEQATQKEENRELVDADNVEETEKDVSESVVEPVVSSANDFSDATKVPVENLLSSDTVELELKEDQEKIFLSHEPEKTDGFSQVVANHGVKGLEETELPPSKDNNELSSVSENEGLRETEVVETIKDMTVAEEEKNVLSSVVTDGLLKDSEEPNETDVTSKETLETTIPKPDESEEPPPNITEEVPKVIEKSYVPSADENVVEPSDVQEPPNESANESLQPLPNVPDAQGTGATVQEETELPRSTENETIASVTQREHTSWRSCCGLFEVLGHGDR